MGKHDSLSPIKLYMHGPSPNPWKVAIILEELGLPWAPEHVSPTELKKPPFTLLNPNGRTPAMVDPNKDITLWESGAIIDYLIDLYDTDNALQYNSFPEKYQTRCWEYFQVSGQGPYMGQKGWFLFYHPEKVPSAIERYDKETQRIITVIDAHLSAKNTQNLVGDKVTYADLMFVPYFAHFLGVIAAELDTSRWEKYSAWMERLCERPSVKKVMEMAKIEGDKMKANMNLK